MYGIREQQLKRYYRDAKRLEGETGPNLISLLEGRLDNAVFRAGLAQTRPQARQMASHRLFMVNGRPVDIPSYPLKPGDTVTVRESKKKLPFFSSIEKRLQNVAAPSWVSLVPKDFGFEITATPTYEEANVGVDVRAVVEYFAR